MIVDWIAGHRVILTVAILSTTPLNFSNVLRNEENQSTRAIGLSTADAALRMGPATKLIAKLGSSVASSSRVASTAVTPVLSGWSVGVSWFIREYSS